MAAQTKGLDVEKQLAWVGFSGVQSAANAFLEITIPTGVTPSGGYGLRVVDLELFARPGNLSAAGSSYLEFALCKESQASMPNYNNTDVLGQLIMYHTTTAAGVGLWAMDFPVELPLNGEILAVDTSLYLDVKSANMGAAVTVYGRMFYEQVALSELEILRILQG